MLTVTRNIKRTIAIFGVVLAMSLNAMAAPKSGKKEALLSQVEFVGKINNTPVFRLAINNEDTVEYSITVKEAGGDVLFFEKVKGSKIARSYQLDTDNVDLIVGTTFEVTNLKTNSTTVYRISSEVATTENIVVFKQ